MKTIKFLIVCVILCNCHPLFAQQDQCKIPIVFAEDVLTLTITKNVTDDSGTFTLTLKDNITKEKSKSMYIPEIEFYVFTKQMKNLLIEFYKEESTSQAKVKDDIGKEMTIQQYLDENVKRRAEQIYLQAHVCQFQKESDEPVAGVIRPNKYIYVFKDLSDDSIIDRLRCKTDTSDKFKKFIQRYDTIVKQYDSIAKRYDTLVKLYGSIQKIPNEIIGRNDSAKVTDILKYKKTFDDSLDILLDDTTYIITKCHYHYKQNRKEKCPVYQYGKCPLLQKIKKDTIFKKEEPNRVMKKKRFKVEIWSRKVYKNNRIFNADFRKKELKEYEIAKKLKEQRIKQILDSNKLVLKNIEEKFNNSKNTLIKETNFSNIDSLLKSVETGVENLGKNGTDNALKIKDQKEKIKKTINEIKETLITKLDLFRSSSIDSLLKTCSHQDSITLATARNTKIDSILDDVSKLESINDDIDGISNKYINDQTEKVTENLNVIKKSIVSKTNDLSGLIEKLKLDSVFLRISATTDKLVSIEKILTNPVEKRINGSSKYNNKLLIYRGLIDSVHYQFQEGQLENIKAYVTIEDLNNEQFVFENNFAMPFTTKGNFANLTNYKLYDKNHSYTVFNGILKSSKNISKRYYSVFTGDLFNYDYAINNYTRDYSPKDQVITTYSNLPQIVKKDMSKELFEMKLYTDLFGVAKDKPNGLIQLEIDKRIAFVTKRLQRNYTLSTQYRSFNWSYFTYVKPSICISKIENKERKLPINSTKSIVNNQLYKELYATSIDILNYESFNISTDLNLLLLDMPEAQMTIYINAGFKYGITLVTDSAYKYEQNQIVANPDGKTNDFLINTFQVYPRISFRFFPEKRYGFSLSYMPSYYKTKNNKVAQIYSDSPDKTDFYNLAKTAKFATAIQAIELNAYFQPSSKDPNGKIFFRYRFNSQFKDINTNFSQIQLGYSYFFTKR